MRVFSSSHFISYNSFPTNALLFSLQNINKVFGSKLLSWSLQRHHNRASEVRWWGGKVPCLARGLLFHRPSSLLWPLCETGDHHRNVVEIHGWKPYNKPGSPASSAEFVIHSWNLGSEKHGDHSPEKLAFRRLQGTALQIRACTGISRKLLLAQCCHGE